MYSRLISLNEFTFKEHNYNIDRRSIHNELASTECIDMLLQSGRRWIHATSVHTHR